MTSLEQQVRDLLSHVRFRVTLAATLVTLLAALIGAALFLGLLHENLEQALLTSARQQADTVQARLQAGGTPQQAVLSGKDDLFIQILDPAGAVIATDHPGVTEPLRTTPGSAEGVVVPGLEDSFAVIARTAGTGDLIVVGLAEEQVTRAVGTATMLLAIGVPISTAVVGAVVWLSVGRALRPVESMREQAAAITPDDLHRRLPVPPGDDEIPRLANTLNQMLDRIESSQRLQRQFVSDASHELRSPLATIRQMSEVARRHPTHTTVPELADSVLAEEHHMESVVEALLTLARLDDGRTSRARLLDLDALAVAEVARVRTGNGPQIDITGVHPAQVSGDPVLLSQVVGNLLSNALRHARRVVRLTCLDEPDRVVLVVEDDGAGIPEADRERIFERFTRLDEARSRDQGGSGLGLAIVDQVMTAHDGRVQVSDGDLGGAAFTLVFPSPGEPAT